MLYQRLVVVAGWLGVSSKAGMPQGLQVPRSDFVGLAGGGAANATRDKSFPCKLLRNSNFGWGTDLWIGDHRGF